LEQIIFNPHNKDDDIFNLPLQKDGFYDTKELISYIKNIESTIRRSIEYREWRKYIIEVLGNNYCLFTNECTTEVSIEIHHHPLTLFNIVDIIINTNIYKNKKFTTLDISKQVLTLHYQNKIGYVPMIKTLHEKYHNGYLVIPSQFILGNWKYLLDDSLFEVSDEIKEHLKIAVANENNLQPGYYWQGNELIKSKGK